MSRSVLLTQRSPFVFMHSHLIIRETYLNTVLVFFLMNVEIKSWYNLVGDIMRYRLAQHPRVK